MQVKTAFSTCMLATTLVLSSGLARAQETQPEAPVVEASTNCFATFAIGPLTYCVSEHGNIARFTAPAAAPEHIRVGFILEGYALCATNAAGVVRISHDAASTESGWQVPITIVQPGGPNTLPLTITRTTLGGIQLIQSFAHNAAEREVIVTMTVRNLSGAALANVRLDRYFDGDIAADPGDDRYNRSIDAVWGEDGPHAVMLSDINFPVISHTTAVHTFGGFVAASCGQASVGTPTAAGDFVGRLSYNLGAFAINGSRSVRVQYRKL